MFKWLPKCASYSSHQSLQVLPLPSSTTLMPGENMGKNEVRGHSSWVPSLTVQHDQQQHAGCMSNANALHFIKSKTGDGEMKSKPQLMTNGLPEQQEKTWSCLARLQDAQVLLGLQSRALERKMVTVTITYSWLQVELWARSTVKEWICCHKQQSPDWAMAEKSCALKMDHNAALTWSSSSTACLSPGAATYHSYAGNLVDGCACQQVW